VWGGKQFKGLEAARFRVVDGKVGKCSANVDSDPERDAIVLTSCLLISHFILAVPGAADA
jgi:hypothetical protein